MATVTFTKDTVMIDGILCQVEWQHDTDTGILPTIIDEHGVITQRMSFITTHAYFVEVFLPSGMNIGGMHMPHGVGKNKATAKLDFIEQVKDMKLAICERGCECGWDEV